jgi:hypothetical protein
MLWLGLTKQNPVVFVGVGADTGLIVTRQRDGTRGSP